MTQAFTQNPRNHIPAFLHGGNSYLCMKEVVEIYEKLVR